MDSLINIADTSIKNLFVFLFILNISLLTKNATHRTLTYINGNFNSCTRLEIQVHTHNVIFTLKNSLLMTLRVISMHLLDYQVRNMHYIYLFVGKKCNVKDP